MPETHDEATDESQDPAWAAASRCPGLLRLFPFFCLPLLPRQPLLLSLQNFHLSVEQGYSRLILYSKPGHSSPFNTGLKPAQQKCIYCQFVSLHDFNYLDKNGL